jgi:hypothetical protein
VCHVTQHSTVSSTAAAVILSHSGLPKEAENRNFLHLSYMPLTSSCCCWLLLYGCWLLAAAVATSVPRSACMLLVDMVRHVWSSQMVTSAFPELIV